MKKLLLSIVFVALGAMTFAQTQLSENQSKTVMATLTEAATAMQSLQCRFVQQRTSSMLAEPQVSEGTMHYAAPDRLRWEYTSPYAFALIVNGEKIVRVTDGKAVELDAKSGRMYQGLVNIIMGSASGKNLFDATLFDIALFDDGDFWKAEMAPKRRDMKRMFSQLVFRFEKKTNTISRVELKDAGGDVTEIRFEGMRVNGAIGEETFQ